jgi:hypothetical protein
MMFSSLQLNEISCKQLNVNVSYVQKLCYGLM